QISLNDKVNNMPEYLRRILINSWAHVFQKVIFPEINEERFSVLYSEIGSRPNSPVNVIIGALILKELFSLTDEDLIGSIFFDDRFQYALRLTSEERPPISHMTFTNFRRRIYKYYEETGIDLIQEEIENLAGIISKHLKIDGKKVRVDSLMVSSSCKNLSRIELVYTVNALFIKALKELAENIIPEECLPYLEKGHKNETIYRSRDTETETKLEFLLKQSKALYDVAIEVGKEVTNSEEFKTLKRMLGEQTKDDDDFDNIEPKGGKDISPKSLQNPSDPDATYRFKYKNNIGYVVNVIEIFNEENSIIKSYDLKQNTYSDQKFSEDTIEVLTRTDSSFADVDDSKEERSKQIIIKQNSDQKQETRNDGLAEHDIHKPVNTDDNKWEQKQNIRQSEQLNNKQSDDKEQKVKNNSLTEDDSSLIQLFTDGAYYSYELAQMALDNDIQLIPSELTGKKLAENKMGYSSFTVDKEENVITECANKKEPVKSEYNEETSTYTAKFSKDDCTNCSHHANCRMTQQSKYNLVKFTQKQHEIDKLREEMQTKEYIKSISQRAAIEGVPSVLRRKYKIDNMPIRGLVCSKIWLGFKIAAYNTKKLFKGLKVAGA
ncbi:transposase, partial [bacterium AH-315-L21]|nr:transposase [bacterium AH-315-L21]